LTTSTHPAYRPDIDGLRAIAVLSVVAFHAFPSAVSGGFVGVDIFFVISGFLISSIILKGLDGGQFTFSDFYGRRIRRILPALMVVLIACFAFGWYALLADEWEVLGKHIGAGALFVSNVLLWDEVDYFDTSADLKPLLHLWSLGVEEQFYIFWPLILFLAWRYRSAVPTLILAIALGSFGLNIGTVEAHPAAAFYLPFARFWQLLSGGLLAYVTLLRGDPTFAQGRHGRLHPLLRRLVSAQREVSGRPVDLASIIGGALIILAIFGINRELAYPGWLALIPVSGTLLLIWAGPRALFNRVILARNFMVFVGLISYPLYLWHWPLLSFARVLGLATPQLVSVLVITSFFLAWATYRFIEIPVRLQKHSPEQTAKITRLLVAGLACLLVVGLATWKSLLPGRLEAVSRDIALARDDWYFPGDGMVGNAGSGTILFLGDSYIRQYYARVEELSNSAPWSQKTVLFETEGGCAPLSGIERRGRGCNSWALEGYRLAEREDVEAIVLGASWVNSLNRSDYYRVDDGSRTTLDLHSADNDWIYSLLEDRIRGWIDSDKRVYIILAHPDGDEANPGTTVPDRLAWTPQRLHRPLSLATHRKKTDFIHDRLRGIAQNTGATIIDPAPWLCEEDVCETRTENGKHLYCDDSHLRASFVRDKARYIDGIVDGHFNRRPDSN
jgi:peptidoglycan/LPS O-acetylase OafA/YrhL